MLLASPGSSAEMTAAFGERWPTRELPGLQYTAGADNVIAQWSSSARRTGMRYHALQKPGNLVCDE